MTAIDLLDETSVEEAVSFAAAQGEMRIIIDATGFLHDKTHRPEKTLRELNCSQMSRSFALNAIWACSDHEARASVAAAPGEAVFATMSARGGSIGDNHLGGWYSYRASKAALNQLVRTAAIELARTHPQAICVALHPGTVETPLSAPFARRGLEVQTPDQAVARLLNVLAH